MNQEERALIAHQEALRKEIEAKILAYLQALPPTKFSIPDFQAMDMRIGTLEKTIKGLKGFIRFLSLLNPMEYLRWMSEAFSHYVASRTAKTTTSTSETPAGLPAPAQDATMSVRPGKSKGKSKKKKSKILTLN